MKNIRSILERNIEDLNPKEYEVYHILNGNGDKISVQYNDSFKLMSLEDYLYNFKDTMSVRDDEDNIMEVDEEEFKSAITELIREDYNETPSEYALRLLTNNIFKPHLIRSIKTIRDLAVAYYADIRLYESI